MKLHCTRLACRFNLASVFDVYIVFRYLGLVGGGESGLGPWDFVGVASRSR